jgi:hypothetical protein
LVVRRWSFAKNLYVGLRVAELRRTAEGGLEDDLAENFVGEDTREIHRTYNFC